MARATENDMEVLHGALCGYFLKLLGAQIPEMVKRTTTAKSEDGSTTESEEWVETGLMVRPSAGEVAVMAKFLKDNAITGAVTDGSGLKDLESKLAERHQRRGKLPNTRDVQEALKELGTDMLQ